MKLLASNSILTGLILASPVVNAAYANFTTKTANRAIDSNDDFTNASELVMPGLT